jgi:hypothetical protein
MPGLTFSNELISRDERLHCDFAWSCSGWPTPPSELAKARAHPQAARARCDGPRACCMPTDSEASLKICHCYALAYQRLSSPQQPHNSSVVQPAGC